MNDLKVVEEFLNTLDKLVIKVSNCLELDENDQQMIATMKLLQGNPKRYTLETISALMSWNAQLVNDLKEGIIVHNQFIQGRVVFQDF